MAGPISIKDSDSRINPLAMLKPNFDLSTVDQADNFAST